MKKKENNLGKFVSKKMVAIHTECITDYLVPGPNPIPIQRVYSSDEKGNGSLCHGNHWTGYGYIKTGQVSVSKNKVENWAILSSNGGARTTYVEHSKNSLKLHKSSIEKGLTNTSLGIISAKTNPLNNKLTLDAKKKKFTMITGDGSSFEYERDGQNPIFHLKKERKPNGLSIIYKHDPNNRLRDVSLLNRNGTTLAGYSCEINKDNLTVSTNNHRNIHYTFQQIKNNNGAKGYYLKSASRPDLPHENYEYSATDSNAPHRLVKKIRPDSRTIGIEYYQKGNNPLPFGNLLISNLEDPRRGRVRCLKAPIGSDSTLLPAFMFTYGMKLRQVTQNPPTTEIEDGNTMVYDANNHLTAYYYNKEHRLSSIEKYTGSGPDYNLYTREKLFWNETKLTNRIFETKEGWAQYACQYDYDSQGNVCRKTLWGNLSGYNDKPIAYPPSGYPEYNGCEFEFKLFTYSQDGRNLMTSQTEGSTAHTIYSYYPETDLLASKLSGPIGCITLREFYEYDQNGVLVIQIQDDGSGFDKDDLNGVTQRHIKRILPSTSVPIGLPLVIEEKYIDLKTGYEDLIRRTVNSYTSEGWLFRKEVYDQNNVFAFVERWEYDSTGNVILYEDPLGRTTTRSYDANHNLVYEQGPSPSFYTEFTYDFSDRLVKKTIVATDGTKFSEEYLYDRKSNLVAVRDYYGNQTTYKYDEFGRKIKTIFPETVDDRGQVVNAEINITYDALSNPIVVTDPLGFQTLKNFTIKGNPYKTTYPDGSCEFSLYNVDGTIQRQTHKNGSYTQYEYDDQKRPIKKEIYNANSDVLDAVYMQYTGFKLIREMTLGGEDKKHFYDYRGRLVETNTNGMRTSYIYDSMGRVSQTKSHFGDGEDEFLAKRYIYDSLNRIIEESEEDNQGNTTKKIEYTYDHSGNRQSVIEHTQNGLSVTTTTYNIFNQPTEIKDPKGNKTLFKYDYNQTNSIGQLVPCEEKIDPTGIVTVTCKDALGKVVSVIKRDAFGHQMQKTLSHYDANGNKIKQIDTVFSTSCEAKEIITSWEYDACNRLVATTEASGTPEQKLVRTVFNAYGEKACVVKPNGTVLHYSYDKLGRLQTCSSSDNTIFYEYTYDERGNLIQVEDIIRGRSTCREYDLRNYLRSETLGNDLTTSYTYDDIGRILSLDLPDASSVQFIYQGSLLLQIKRLDKLKQSTYTHTYQKYGLGGQLLEEKCPGNAGKTIYSYDTTGRLIDKKSPQWSETSLNYDSVGNLLSRTLVDAIDTIECQYDYDKLYQITSERGCVDESYAWDSMYNRIFRNGKNSTFNKLNQLVNDDNTVYRYDLNGNLIEIHSSIADIELIYDAFDRLIQVSDGSRQWHYEYDDSDRRLVKSHFILLDGQWHGLHHERFLYCSQNEIGMVNEQNTFEQFRVLGQGKGAEIGATVLIEINGKAYVPHHDHNGNIVCLVDPKEGTVVECYRYSAFGEEELYDATGTQIKAAINPWRFSSKRKDTETELVYFGRRYYSPKTGRWITADPIGFNGGPNLYAYVLNNPLTLFDLYGLTAESTAQEPGGFSSFVSDCFLRFQRAHDRMICRLGSMMEHCGNHLLPIPIVQDGMRAIGYSMQGKSFDNFKTWGANKSYCSSLGLPERNPKILTLIGGGIDTTEEEMLLRSKITSQKLGGNNVSYFYNSTHGFMADGCEWTVQRAGLYTRSAKVLAKYCRKKIKEMGGTDGDGRINLLVHSQSGEIAYNLKDHLRPEELKILHVRTFGSPRQIEEGIFGSITNYVSGGDWIPSLNYLRTRTTNPINSQVLPKSAMIEHSWNTHCYQRAIEEELKRINLSL